uniref:Ubiquitin-like protease family profile domain-containing protein n=1 Tax=Oryza glumipatula TaxID=40148 RepID=A0A0E0AMB3_9ORYZ
MVKQKRVKLDILEEIMSSQSDSALNDTDSGSQSEDIPDNNVLDSDYDGIDGLNDISKDDLLKSLKKKLTKRNFDKDAKTDYVFTRFSVKYFSKVMSALSVKQKEVIGRSCFASLLQFDRCFVPNHFASWIANHVDVKTCDIIVNDKAMVSNLHSSINVIIINENLDRNLENNSDVIQDEQPCDHNLKTSTTTCFEKSNFAKFNDRKPILSHDDMPKFQIWDSEDDVDALDNEEFTPICYVKKSSIVPDSFSPNSNEDSPDCVILGERKFSDKISNLTNQTNFMYNNLNKFHNQDQYKSYTSPERILCNVDNSVGSSYDCEPRKALRRILIPAKYCTDPYTPQRHSFPVSQYQRHIFNAVCKLSSSAWQVKVAVDIDHVHCKFTTFGGSFKHGAELSNFVLSVFCRYLFKQYHPSKSKKHYFLSSIGDELLKHHSTTDFKNVKKCFDGAGYARPVHTCDMLFFPILHQKHWFLFIADLKDKNFVFVDSLFDEDHEYQVNASSRLIENFRTVWNKFVPNHPINFQQFKTIYPPRPKQTNRVNCGIFMLKCMELWAPRILLPNMFSQKDIPNIRIQYVNQLFFHPNNSVLNTPTKTLVTEYSEVQNMIIFSLQIYYLCYCKVFKIFEYLFL